MKKIFLIPILILLLCSFAFAFDTSSETIIVSYPEIKDPYLSSIKPIATTINVDKNIAYTEASEGVVSIDKFEVNSGEEAIISFSKTSKDTLYDICINGFVGFEKMIKLQNFKKSNNWWFDDNLLNSVEKQGDLYCFSSFQADDVTKIKFKAEYSGEGKLKYDLYILPASYNKNFNIASQDDRLIILDPYLIGDYLDSSEGGLIEKYEFNNKIGSVGYTSEGGVALYNLADNPSGTLEDKWGSSDGTRNNGQTGVVCDGVDDSINLNSLTNMTLTNGFTINILTEFKSLSGTYSNILDSQSSTDGLSIRLQSDNSISAFIYNSSNSASVAGISELNLSLNDIYLLTFIYNGTNFISYLNGEEQTVGSEMTGGIDDITKKLTLCSNFDGLSNYLNASVYNITFSSHIMTQEEIQEVYELNKPETRSSYYLTDGLVAGYDFALNQNSDDISGNGNDGTDTNVNYIGTGMVGNGVDSYITTTTTENTNKFTLGIKANWINTSSDSIIFSSKNTSSEGIILYNNEADNGKLYIYSPFFDLGQPLSCNYLVEDNLFHKININANINNISCFIDGIQTASYPTALQGTIPFDTIDIGRRTQGATQYFNGTIDSVMIFNRTLSDEEILALNNSGNFVNDKNNESNSAINLTNSYVYTDLNTSTSPTSLSYWYSNGVTWNNYIKSGTDYYINGENTTAFSLPFTFGSKTKIGTSSGLFDNVLFYNRLLTEDEIDILYNGFGGAFNIEFFDEKTGDKINNVTLEVFSESQSSNYTTTTGEFFLNGFPREITTIRYRSDGYKENFYYIDFSDIDEQLFEATLYLLNSSDSDEISITVYDNGGFNKLNGVYLKILKFFPEDNQFKIVGMAETNYNGVTKIGAEKNQEFYKFQLFYPNLLTLATTTQQSYIFEDQLNLRLPIESQIGQGFNKTMGIVSTMKYNTVTDSFDYEYSNTAGTNVNTTVTVTKLVAGQTIVVNSSIGTSSAGTISVPVSVINDTTYIATAVIDLGDENGITNQLSYINFNDNKIGNYGILIIIILTLAFIFIGYFSLSIMVALVPLPLLFGSLIGIVQFDFRFAIVIQILAVIVSLLVKF